MLQPLAASSRYLDSRVATASQPELQLMLLEGALRFGRHAEQLWNEADQRSECDALMTRTIGILEELIRGVTLGGTDLSKRLEEEYAFAYRQLAFAQLNHDAAPLAAALKVLDFHRETWKQACEKLRAETMPASPLSHLAFNDPPLGASSLSLQG